MYTHTYTYKTEVLTEIRRGSTVPKVRNPDHKVLILCFTHTLSNANLPTVLQAGFFHSYKRKLRFKEGKSPDEGRTKVQAQKRSLLHCPELTYSPRS